MGKRPLMCLLLLVALAACDPGQSDRRGNGPQLIEDVTLAPTTPAPTRVLSPTPSPLMIPVMTSTGSSELVSPLDVSTLDANFILVTPTLPPSKTPTLTPTVTLTYSRTPPATVTPYYPYVPGVPTVSGISGLVPIPTAITNIQPQSSNCTTPWFFAQVHPSDCPLNPPLTSMGAFLQFQNGFMIWIQQQDAIYVLYDSANFPRWQVFNDTWVDGVPDGDPAYDNPPAYTWQPKRGFGLLWRNQSAVRERLGWSVIEWETPFDAQVQLGSTGTIYVNEPRGGIFMLTADGSEWKRYE